MGFPGGAGGKEPAFQCRRCKRCQLDPWVGKIPQRRKWQPTPVFLCGESHGQRSLAGCSPQGRPVLDTTKQLSRHAQYNWDGNQGLRRICTVLVLKLKKMGIHHIIPYIFVVAICYILYCKRDVFMGKQVQKLCKLDWKEEVNLSLSTDDIILNIE